MDSKYLKANVGDALTKGLSSIAVSQPADAVDFLGNFLLNYHAQKLAEQSAKEPAPIAEEDTSAADALAAEAAAKLEVEQALEAELLAAEDVPALLGKTLELIKSATGASGVYLGRKAETLGEAPLPQIQYIAADAASAGMIGQSLVEEPDEGDEEGGPKGKGVTFDVWKLVEPEDPQPDEEGNVPGPKAPDFVHVPNVIRDARVKFFGVPKLGGYLAVPISTNSYLQPTVFDVEPTDEEPADPDAEPDAEPVVKRTPSNPTVVSLVLALDRMSQGTGFTPDAITAAQKWAALLGRALEDSERRIFEAEAAARKTEADDNAAKIEEIEQKNAAEAAAAEEKAAAEAEAAAAAGAAEEGAAEAEAPPPLSDEEQAVVAAQAKATALVAPVQYLQEQLLLCASYRIGPKAGPLSVLQAALCLLGTPTADMLDWGLPNWDKTRQLITSDTFVRIASFSAETQSTKSTEELRAATEGVDGEALTKASVAYSALFAWLQAALELKDAWDAAAVAKAAAEAAAAEAAAEAAAAE